MQKNVDESKRTQNGQKKIMRDSAVSALKTRGRWTLKY